MTGVVDGIGCCGKRESRDPDLAERQDERETSHRFSPCRRGVRPNARYHEPHPDANRRLYLAFRARVSSCREQDV